MQEIAETKARVLFIMTETFTVADPQLIVASHWSPTKKHAELYVTVSLHFGVITLQRIWVTASQHHCVTASLRHSVTSILWETLMVHRRSERVDFLLQVGVKTLNFWPAVHISAVKFFLFILIFIGGRSDSRPWQQLDPKNRIRLSFFGRNSSDLFWSDLSWRRPFRGSRLKSDLPWRVEMWRHWGHLAAYRGNRPRLFNRCSIFGKQTLLLL